MSHYSALSSNLSSPALRPKKVAQKSCDKEPLAMDFDIMETSPSPFLVSSSVSSVNSLAIVYLRRDHQIPTILRDHDDLNEGYEEGKVLNTKFGSFPHKTLISLPWGSQVRASQVDTGSRGRRGGKHVGSKKRSRETFEVDDNASQSDRPTTGREAIDASSGFVHLLNPTPENWTLSLPHRTQVVYTPDYSYVLHRLRARPGTQIIEAGAGSGSFTHASARAVYSGYPGGETSSKSRLGKVWSFEFHEQRHEKLVKELRDHNMGGIVQVTHRDVCAEGFLVDEASPEADAIFLDLPAPWLALPHLTRRAPPDSFIRSDEPPSSATDPATEPRKFVSALSSTSPVHLCTFSPCIEQVQRTVSALRQLGWVDIDMVEIAHKKIDVKRERLRLGSGAERGVIQSSANVDEALSRLRVVEGRFRAHHGNDAPAMENRQDPIIDQREKAPQPKAPSKPAILRDLIEKKTYKDGRLVHRSEPELKTHTSYLLFAVLPREWSPEDEAKARARWPLTSVVETNETRGKEVLCNGISEHATGCV